MDDTNEVIDKIIKLKEGTQIVARENIKILRKKANSSYDFFDLCINQVNE